MEEPPELAAMRLKAGQQSVENSPEMIFRKKRFRFLRAIRQGQSQNSHLNIEIRREQMYEDTFTQFQRFGKKDLNLKPRINFKGEAGIDSGGLTKVFSFKVVTL